MEFLPLHKARFWLCANAFVPISVILCIIIFCNKEEKEKRGKRKNLVVEMGYFTIFMNLYIPEQKSSLLTRQLLEDGASLFWSMSHTPHYFLQDQLCNMVVVMYFQFPLPLLSIKLFEAASLPSQRSQIPVYLFSIPLVFRSDPVSDYLIYRRSFYFQLELSSDPKQSQQQKPHWLHAASLFAPWSQFTNIIKLFDALEQNPQFPWDLDLESMSRLLHLLKTPRF